MTDVYNCPSCGEESICTPECEGLRVAFRDITHRVEVAEQELRETAGELEVERARVVKLEAEREQDLSQLQRGTVAMERSIQTIDALRARVKEATDLLTWGANECEPALSDFPDAVGAFLSRAPAQPAAPTPVRAPNPETVARILADPDCAAPEPSAGQGVGFEQLWEGWRGRALAAEARLAAVPGQIESAVAKRIEAAILNALRYEREESHSNTTRRALVIESRMDEALALLEAAARIVENDDWRDRYDVLRGFIAADPVPVQKPALRPEFIALGKALCEPLAPVTPAPSPGADQWERSTQEDIGPPLRGPGSGGGTDG